MSFFCTKEIEFILISCCCRHFLVNKKSVTLQVRIPEKYTKLPEGRKRMSFSVSGSLTVEAAMVLPLFLFAGVILMMPLHILDVERQVQAAAEQVAEEISQGAYAAESWKTEDFLTSASARGYGEAAVRKRIGGLSVERISLAGSGLLADGETVDLMITYQIKLPFSVFRMGTVKRTCRSVRRAWIGKSGGSEEGKTDAGMGADGVIVYVGKDSTRYHRDAQCHYLYNKLQAVSAGELETLRNRSGSRYKPCSRCGGKGETVYIMESGESYHSSANCISIQAYVREAALEEVEDLGPCTYCSGGY